MDAGPENGELGDACFIERSMTKARHPPFPFLLAVFLTLTPGLSAQQPDDPQGRTLNALRNFAVHARVQLSQPAALPSIDEALLRERLEDAIRKEGLEVQQSNDVRNGTQAEVGLHYLVVALPDSWGRPSSFAASSCIEASQLVRLQRITGTGAPVYAVVPTWRTCGMLVGDKVSFHGTILRNADEQIARFIRAWRKANAASRAEPATPGRSYSRVAIRRFASASRGCSAGSACFHSSAKRP